MRGMARKVGGLSQKEDFAQSIIPESLPMTSTGLRYS